jgi:hypothetical protein
VNSNHQRKKLPGVVTPLLAFIVMNSFLLCDRVFSDVPMGDIGEELCFFIWLNYLVFGMWRGIGSLNPDAMPLAERVNWFIVNLVLSCILAVVLYFADLAEITHGMAFLLLCLTIFRSWRCLRVMSAFNTPGEVEFYRRHGMYYS